MFCTKCGKQIPDDSRVCPLCDSDLSYESNAVRNHLTPKKKRKKKSHASGILIGCAFALLAAEGVYLIGYTPVHMVKSTNFTAAPSAETNQGVIDLIPTAEPTAAPSPAAKVSVDEPTPTPTVTPVAQVPASEVTAVAPTSAPVQEAAPETTPEATPVPEMEVVIEDETVLQTDPEDSSDTIIPIDSSQVFPDSSSEPISTSSLEGMSAEELRIARNEIYARHGLIFKSEDLNNYFRSQDWYEGTVTDADSISLSEQEYENIQRIVAYEEAMGYNQ